MIRIARFWARFDLIVAISARTRCFGDFILRTPLPMSTFISLLLPSTLLVGPITPWTPRRVSLIEPPETSDYTNNKIIVMTNYNVKPNCWVCFLEHEKRLLFSFLRRWLPAKLSWGKSPERPVSCPQGPLIFSKMISGKNVLEQKSRTTGCHARRGL